MADVAEHLDTGQLAALSAVVEFGSFDAAAEHLHVTPSAISQRIKALEQRVGQVVVLREKPCVATAAGAPLLRLAAQVALLEAEALSEMRGGTSGSPTVALAVNADSMATWFTEVFERLPHVLFDVRIEDQDHSARLLREGVVMGAVTTERRPVGGCRVKPLGVMRYLPVATPAFVERFLPDGFTRQAAAQAPSLAWNRDDALQDQLLRKVFRTDVRRPTHYIPTAAGFGAAVHAGLGWGMYPISLIDASFVPIADQHLDVPLFWQCWKLDSTTVAEVTDAVESAAAGLLRAA
ncbi:LysR family transcriptional regulator ArgP [Mycolicibacterium iranicum]|uniref:HTH-type transcriptional regulator LysG n=1 Tax=Mycolicibacterium iranicum TaxID=912594 RepID=A0A178LWQ4_MYCIR|nr:LysR family transcriptional regulator ArgP [Mycolicibacterium iranicum]OAN38953.1 transcriptional regulator ArgP [Mycolicibacterium iranicum]